MERRKSVLLLDFDADLLITLERLLEDCGFNCTSTWHVDQGYALMESGVFDFLVIGHRPPELHAHQILADLREQGLRFGCFILGDVDRQDGFSNLLDRLRRFPCEFRAEQAKPSNGVSHPENSDVVRHAS